MLVFGIIFVVDEPLTFCFITDDHRLAVISVWCGSQRITKHLGVIVVCRTTFSTTAMNFACRTSLLISLPSTRRGSDGTISIFPQWLHPLLWFGKHPGTGLLSVAHFQTGPGSCRQFLSGGTFVTGGFIGVAGRRHLARELSGPRLVTVGLE